MIEFPTPTPFPDLGGTPFPTLAGYGIRELSVETVQWWNKGVELNLGPALQAMALVAIIFFGVVVITKALQSFEG